ncbi:MAG: mandelate racemase/muconate lactonizing enzyme family protein [Rhodospirillales bacterium]|nr:MAG: mandelate racemase/muconate lactonizing enzyme family protein [Rhodospirillales bacterium]
MSRHRLPLDPPFVAAWDSRARESSDVSIVRITTADGAVGIGAGGTMDGVERYYDLFVGHDPLDLERHAAILANLDFHGVRPWALDVALWDLVGKIRKQPVWHLLGGRSGTVPCYASTGVLREKKALTDAVSALAGQGFKAVKLRLHHADWREGIAILEAVAITLSGKAELLVDCNQGWRMPWDAEACWTYHQALAAAWELKRLGVYWMEEPVHHGDVKAMAALRGATGLRIAAGEMTRGEHALADLVDRNAVDVLQPDATLTCGILAARRLARRAAERDVAFTPHSWGSGIGLLVNAHIFAGCGGSPWLEYPLDPPEWTAERRDFMLAQPIKAGKDGCIELSDAPGFGIELDEERLAATRVD